MKFIAIIITVVFCDNLYKVAVKKNRVAAFLHKDSLQYIYIPPGEYFMGCIPGDTLCEDIEKPQHTIHIQNGFYISATEVTVKAFGKFIDATGFIPDCIKQNKGRIYDNEKNWQWVEGINWKYPFNKNSRALDEHPVTQVSYNDAVAYCKWAGGRLPTEEEWEYAARGGQLNKKYPWGNEWPPLKYNRPLANTADKNTLSLFSTMEGIKNYDDGFMTTAPVASFPANNYGLYDMAGNVWEWTSLRFYTGYASKEIDSVFIKNDVRIVRGGAWCYHPRQMSCSYRGYFEKNDFWTGSLGFRCVMDSINK